MAAENYNEELVRQTERFLRLARNTGKDVRVKVRVLPKGVVVAKSTLIEKEKKEQAKP